jgi:hypothetical protein
LGPGVWLYTLKIAFAIFYINTGCWNLVSKFYGFDKKSGVFYLLNYIFDKKAGTNILWILFGVDIIAFFVILFFIIKQYIKKKLLIIEHSSLQTMKFSYDKSETEEYAAKQYSINQYGILVDETLPLKERVNSLILDIDKHLVEILKYVKKEYQIAYAGIANIPATFLLGYELGDENKKTYLHKNRKDSLDDDFHILKNDERHLNFSSDEQRNNPNKKGKILLLIQLTQPIGETDILNVKEENDYVIKYNVPETIGYDIVDSAHQINAYTTEILKKISAVQKNSNITQIKICVAASSAFVFALGSKFSKTQNIETIIYHFQNNGYPWGINVTKKEPVISKH